MDLSNRDLTKADMQAIRAAVMKTDQHMALSPAMEHQKAGQMGVLGLPFRITKHEEAFSVGVRVEGAETVAL